MNGPDGKKFVWGKIRKIHSIGPYDIVEFTWKSFGELDGAAGFSVFVDKVDICQSPSSLDEALVLAISWNHGEHGNAAFYFMRMLKP